MDPTQWTPKTASFRFDRPEQAMSFRDRMLLAMRGYRAGRPVFAPRMDLWYIAQSARGTLPGAYAGMTMAHLADELGVGCHAVRGDYTLPREPEALALRGLGFDNHPDYPFRVDVEGLELRFETEDDTFSTTIETPKGPIGWTLRHTADMARSGVSLPFVLRYPVETPKDLERLTEVFDHLVIHPTPDAFGAFRDRVGDRGVAVANGCIASSPLHLLLHDLMPMDRFFYAYHDDPLALARFSERATPLFDRMLAVLAESKAEVVLWGGNFDRDVTWPPFYDREIVPSLRRARAVLGAAGKLVLCHTDGENDGLFDGYRAAGFDVAESVCPAPMTRNTLGQIRALMGSSICVWGGVPSVVLLPDSTSEREFRVWLDELCAEIGRRAEGSPLILGVSDNVPPDADFGRLMRIAAAIDAAG